MSSALLIEYVALVFTLLELPVPVVHVVQVPQAQIIEKTVEFPVVQTAHSTRTPESLETVLVCEMKPMVTVEIVELGSLLPAVAVSPLSMTAPVVDVPLVVMEQRVDEFNIENPVDETTEVFPIHEQAVTWTLFMD